MDYWYHHAAIVVWPEEAHEDVLTRYDFAGACVQLAEMASRKGAATRAKFLALGRAAIAKAEKDLADRNEHTLAYGSERALPILSAVADSGSEELFARCQKSLLPHLLAVCDADGWKKLFAAFGHEVAAGFFASTTATKPAESRDALFSAMAALLKAQTIPEDFARSLAGRLPESLGLDADGRRHFVRNRSNQLSAEQRLHIAIAASFLIGDESKRAELREIALAGGSLDHLREILAPALRAKTHRRHLAHGDSLFLELLAAARDRLGEEVASKLAPYPDWTRPYPESKPAVSSYAYQRGIRPELATELKQFMADPAAGSHRFTRAQADRDALENLIRALELDLDRSTETKGRPYTLVCTKNENSYRRALKRRADDKLLLAQLEALGEN